MFYSFILIGHRHALSCLSEKRCPLDNDLNCLHPSMHQSD
ncbi:hypothetical protein Vi05172_g6035 [Venturia inaequalis]|nr:hypothetical protein Vi05172_g6035 [Venturia inaequalis]